MAIALRIDVRAVNSLVVSCLELAKLSSTGDALLSKPSAGTMIASVRCILIQMVYILGFRV